MPCLGVYAATRVHAPKACPPRLLRPPCRSEVRDPRFESLSAGQYSEEQFKRRYAFLYDEKLPQERADLKAALKRAKGAGPRAELQAQLTRVEQQLRSEDARRRRDGFKQQVKVRPRAGRRLLLAS